MPQACATLIGALREHLTPPVQVVVRTRAGDTALPLDWQAAVRELGQDDVEVYVVPSDATGLPGVLAARNAHADSPIAYVCRGVECLAPVREASALLDAARA